VEYPNLEFFRACEVQKRGALHHHMLVRSPEPLLLSWIRQAAMDAGYGHSVDLKVIERHSRKAASYVAKYVTKATDLREEVPWLGEVVDTDTGEVTVERVPGRYRTWSMSRGYGDSMAAVRADAALYARLRSAERAWLAERDQRALIESILGSCEVVGLPEPGAP
jgi:hypothetical protein